MDVASLLKNNRCGHQPKWSQLGLDVGDLPIHVKKVEAARMTRPNDGPKDPRQYLDDMAEALGDPELKRRWFRVRKWITEKQVGVPRGSIVEADLNEAEVTLMFDAGQCAHTTFEMVEGTVVIFTVPEHFKQRRRVIKHTKAFNQAFGKDTLEGIRLLSNKDLVQSVHDGEYAICVDYSAYFDQIPLSENVSRGFCFPVGGQWYRLTRLPMGMRQSVDVAQTASEVIASFAHPSGIRIDVYVDNVRILGHVKEDVIEAAVSLIQRCRAVNVQINEIAADEDAREAAKRLIRSDGEFLGVHFNYITKKVRVGEKAIAKLAALERLLSAAQDRFSHRNFLGVFGLLFFALQVTRLPARGVEETSEGAGAARDQVQVLAVTPEGDRALDRRHAA